MTRLNIGLFGGGNVGGGVYELITNANNANVSISRICMRDLTKSRDFVINPTTVITDDVETLLNDPNINCIVEVCGGTTLAKDVVLRALSSGKHVITANKALIAHHMPEILDTLSKAPGPPHFAYEAAVCGGIPIINSLQSSYSNDMITSVSGIMNGTTNFMLCKMESGADYGEVLAEAQALGFAEADPTADVEGHDVQSKICIIAKLAFGTTVPVANIPCAGISSISSVDFEYATLLKSTIKLVGTAARTSKHGENDGPLTVFVAPKMVPLTHMLASARGPGNAVQVVSRNVGTTGYIGPGAGRFPTANSIVADIMRIANGVQCAAFPKESSLEVSTDYASAFYVRISISDGLGVIKRVGEIAERNGVSINSILQNSIKDREKVDFVVTSEVCLLSQIEGMCSEIEGEGFCRGKPLVMGMMSDE